jgi:hypothetical protein
MDSFRTPLLPATAPFSIDLQDRLMLVGSCFTENIGARLRDRKFNTLINPFGIVYNPMSVAHCLSRLLLENQLFTADDLVENAGLWHSWQHHGHFSHPDKTTALQGINDAYSKAAQHLQNTDTLLLTLGTAHVFLLRSTGQIVANNHKMPAAAFENKLLDVAEVTDALGAVFADMLQKKPELKIVLSISPVRHLRQGMVENQRSKATLVLACDALCRQFPQVVYFPAYELLLDDLRDYRFYAADMIHPSEVAVAYIWQYFSDMFFDPATKALLPVIEKIRAAAQHRPFHPDTPQHHTFAAAQLAAIAQLENQRPGLDFSMEKQVFNQILGGA